MTRIVSSGRSSIGHLFTEVRFTTSIVERFLRARGARTVDLWLVRQDPVSFAGTQGESLDEASCELKLKLKPS
jgi:hypothetical protein